MKLINYDKRYLIFQKLRNFKCENPTTYTQSQYKILCNLIRQKNISKEFFLLILDGLFDMTDWKKLNYQQMYELIHVLTYFDYERSKR